CSHHGLGVKRCCGWLTCHRSVYRLLIFTHVLRRSHCINSLVKERSIRKNMSYHPLKKSLLDSVLLPVCYLSAYYWFQGRQHFSASNRVLHLSRGSYWD